MFTPQDDPLGLGLKQRARAHRQSYEMLNPQNPAFMSGPLPDQDWDAFFQAVGESNPGKNIGFAGDESPAGSTQLTGFRPNHLIGDGTHGENMLEQADPFSRLAQISRYRRRQKSGGI